MPINRAWVGFFSLAVFTVTLFQNCSAGNFEVVHSAGGMNAKESASLDIGGNRNGNQKCQPASLRSPPRWHNSHKNISQTCILTHGRTIQKNITQT